MSGRLSEGNWTSRRPTSAAVAWLPPNSAAASRSGETRTSVATIPAQHQGIWATARLDGGRRRPAAQLRDTNVHATTALRQAQALTNGALHAGKPLSPPLDSSASFMAALRWHKRNANQRGRRALGACAAGGEELLAL